MDPWQICSWIWNHSVTSAWFMDLCLGAEGISRWIRKRPFTLDLRWTNESCSQITIIQVQENIMVSASRRRRDKRVGISDRKGTGAWSQSREAHKADTQNEPCRREGHMYRWLQSLAVVPRAASSYAGHWCMEHILYENDILSELTGSPACPQNI